MLACIDVAGSAGYGRLDFLEYCLPSRTTVGKRGPGHSFRWRIPTALVLAVALIAMSSTTVFGYDRSAAAAYAEAHWNSCGVSGTYPCISNDCANYASQVIHAGGVDWVGLNNPNESDPHQWFAKPGPQGTWQVTTTWKFAENLYDFLIWDNPGGTLSHTWPGTSTTADSTGDTGDLVFYDWNPAVPDGGSEPRDHVNPIVGYGDSVEPIPAPPHSPYHGDMVNGHTNYRHHYFWSLPTVNTQKLTTTIYVMHILNAN